MNINISRQLNKSFVFINFNINEPLILYMLILFNANNFKVLLKKFLLIFHNVQQRLKINSVSFTQYNFLVGLEET